VPGPGLRRSGRQKPLYPGPVPTRRKKTCRFEPSEPRLGSAARWAGWRRALCAEAFIHAPQATHPGPADFSPRTPKTSASAIPRKPKKNPRKPKEYPRKPKKSPPKPRKNSPTRRNTRFWRPVCSCQHAGEKRRRQMRPDTPATTTPRPAHPPGVAMARIDEVFPACRSESARTPPVSLRSSFAWTFTGNAICAAWQWALLSRSFHRVEPAP
jgi:hypothetical protein